MCHAMACLTVPTKEWVNEVSLSSFELENFFKFVLAWLASEKQNILTPQPQANTPLGQLEQAYYLSYFIYSMSICLRADVSYCNKGNRRHLHAGNMSMWVKLETWAEKTGCSRRLISLIRVSVEIAEVLQRWNFVSSSFETVAFF